MNTTHMRHQVTNLPSRAARDGRIKAERSEPLRQPRALGRKLINVLVDFHAAHCGPGPGGPSKPPRARPESLCRSDRDHQRMPTAAGTGAPNPGVESRTAPSRSPEPPWQTART